MAVGFLAVMLLGQWFWLEMRINTALALPVFTLAGMILPLFTGKSLTTGTALAVQVFVIFVFGWLFNFDFQAIRVLPAAWIREGFGLDFISIHRINLIAAGIIISGNAAFLFPCKDRLST